IGGKQYLAIQSGLNRNGRNINSMTPELGSCVIRRCCLSSACRFLGPNRISDCEANIRKPSVARTEEVNGGAFPCVGNENVKRRFFVKAKFPLFFCIGLVGFSVQVPPVLSADGGRTKSQTADDQPALYRAGRPDACRGNRGQIRSRRRSRGL